ncbi:MAG: hypothetical protein WBI04_06600 [Trichlorobacter sp.]|jgi:TM2 domain-containing membrane protein YozV
MKRPLTALLLNALVLPGAGQLYLGRRIRGVVLILLLNLLLLAALFFMMKIMSPVIGAQLTGSPISASAVMAQFHQHSFWAKLLLAAFLALWGYGLLDLLSAFRNPTDE